MGEETGGSSINWLRWTGVGCLLWVAFVILTGASTIALILTPVIGPISGWLLGGAIYLLGGLARP